MTDTGQQQQDDWEDEGGASPPEPKQETATDSEIPAPQRKGIMDAFRRIVRSITKKQT